MVEKASRMSVQIIYDVYALKKSADYGGLYSPFVKE